MPKLVDVLGPVAKLISHHRELMILSSAARKPSYTSDIAATLILPPSMLSLFALLRLLANDQGPNNAGSAAIGSLMLVLVSAAYGTTPVLR